MFGKEGRHWHRHWRRSGPWGTWSNQGFDPSTAQPLRWERGDLKFVILDLLQEKPRHGYSIITDLEKRFAGLYSPSPGSIYPILQLLEDQGFVSNKQQEGKKVYTLTNEGESYLGEHHEAVTAIQKKVEEATQHKGNPTMHEFLHEVRAIGQMIFRAAAHGQLNDPEKLRQMQEIMSRSHSEIEAILSENENME